MSIIIFFGMSAVIFLVGVIYVALTIRHHWRLSHTPQNPISEDKKS